MRHEQKPDFNHTKKIFCLQPATTLLVSVPCYMLVIYALSVENVNPVLAYMSYFLSAYALVITVTGMKGIAQMLRQGVERHPLVKKMRSISLIDRLVREDAFRAETALYQGFLVNFLYAAVKIFSGIRYRSVWFITLAVYYILLAVMRFSLLCYIREGKKNKVSEWLRYRLCGIILLFMNAALAGMVILVVYENSGFEYPGALIYIMAVYAFYAAIAAVWNLIKFRRYGSPILSAAKVISLTAALVSMLALETAMLTQFGAADDAGFRRMMTVSTGAGISILVLGMAGFMILHATRQMEQIKQEKEL